jgi:hypothetical protein
VFKKLERVLQILKYKRNLKRNLSNGYSDSMLKDINWSTPCVSVPMAEQLEQTKKYQMSKV